MCKSTTLIGILLGLLLVWGLGRCVQASYIKIKNPSGIQEAYFITIPARASTPAMQMAVQIRGEDIKNPVVVFIHGGPGGPHAALNYLFQRPLEDKYTFVNYDQRGSGRTYYANAPDTPVSFDLCLEDLDALVDWVREYLQQKQIILMGHSWGSILGIEYIKQHPEKVQAYVGLAQEVNPIAEEALNVEAASRIARTLNREEEVNIMQTAFWEFQEAAKRGHVNREALKTFQALTLGKYFSPDNRNLLLYLQAGPFASEMTWKDLRWYTKLVFQSGKVAEIERPLEQYLVQYHNQTYLYHVPVYLLSGKDDRVTPVKIVQDFYRRIEAPQKDFILISHCGHTPFFERPFSFQKAFLSLPFNKERKAENTQD